MKKQAGMTLVELMISLLIGLVIVAATISIYIATARSSSDTVKAARLNHDLESIMTLMINDIRRAGYWRGATVAADSQDNPFTNSATTNIQVPTSSCVLYTYDSPVDTDGNGAVSADEYHGNSVVDASEYYGFKLDNNTIKVRISGTTTANCADGTWQEHVTGTQVTVTGLTFTRTYKCLNTATATSYNSDCASLTAAQLPSGSLAVESREIDITLSGRLSDDATVTKTLTNFVKVRNDRIFTQ